MKKLLFSIVSIVLAVSMLSACGANNSSDSGKSSNTKTTTSSGNKTSTKPTPTPEPEYVVNIDDSFDSGIELNEARETLSPEESDFRNLKWGMTKDEVAYAQGNGYTEEENKMIYARVREEEFPADAEYTFVDEKLAQGIFFITENKEDQPIQVDDYYALVNTLAKRFGEPKIASNVFVDESETTEDRAKMLELISNGRLQLRTGWMLDDTELRVVMFNGKNGAPTVGLQYQQTGVTIPQE